MSARPVDGERTEVSVIAAQYSPSTSEWWERFEEDFEAAHSDVDLVVECVPWSDIYTEADARVDENDPPDILNMDAFAVYQADGLLLPAGDYISERLRGCFYPAFLEQSDVDGTAWALPGRVSACAMYCNKELLEAAGISEPPATWSELREVCQKIKSSFPEICPWGVDLTAGTGWSHIACCVWNNGGGFVDSAGNWALNSPENAEAVQFVAGLVNAGLTNSDPANEDLSVLWEMLSAGELAMMIGPCSLPADAALSGGDAGGLTIAAIPANDGKAAASVGGVMDRFMCFDKGQTDAELAAITAFFDFFYEDERYSAWTAADGFLPATKGGVEALEKSDPAQAAWVDIMKSCKFYPTERIEWGQVRQGLVDAGQKALQGVSAQELLDELQNQAAAYES